MTRAKPGDAMPLVEWCFAGGAMQSASCHGLGRADALVCELTMWPPRARVWLDGEVQCEGDGFKGRAERRPAR